VAVSITYCFQKESGSFLLVCIRCLVHIREKYVVHDLNPISTENDLEIFRDAFRMALGTKKID